MQIPVFGSKVLSKDCVDHISLGASGVSIEYVCSRAGAAPYRHPNYLGVELEILSAPLVHSAYLTSAVFGAANALLLRARIRREEQALEAYGRDNGYREVFEQKID